MIAREVMILARWLAGKAVKAEWKAMGRNAEASEIAAAANVYFVLHRKELLSEARAHPVAIHYRHRERMRLARKAVIAEIRDRGGRVNSIDPSELKRLIGAYLKEHPEEGGNQGNRMLLSPWGSGRFVTNLRTLPHSQLPKQKANPSMTDTSSTIVNRTLPRRLPNTAYRVREYLTEKEVDRLIETAKRRGRNGQRDAAAILLAYRHGLRATELCSLRWAQIDLRHGRLHVNRAKGGQESVHPLHGPELRALRPLQGQSPYVFTTETGTPVTTAWFLRMVQRTGKAAKLPFPIHPHMLRHSTGYKLANDGQDTRSLAHYLGHRNLQSTARYTALAPDRFKGFWKD